MQSSGNNGPFGNYRKVAKMDELFEVIRTVHQDQLVHSGVLMTYTEVFFEFVYSLNMSVWWLLSLLLIFGKTFLC